MEVKRNEPRYILSVTINDVAYLSRYFKCYLLSHIYLGTYLGTHLRIYLPPLFGTREVPMPSCMTFVTAICGNSLTQVNEEDLLVPGRCCV